MSRKLILASTITMVLAGTDAFALGLGGLRTQSGLNQPFSAEIDLQDAKPDELDAIKASIASSDAFSKVGVERYYYLTRLQFTPEISPQGKAVIRVSSQEPIREPYMDFVVEVVWPDGQLVRQYTVLLDPPLSSKAQAPNVQSPRVRNASSSGQGSVASLARDSASSAAYIPAPGDGFPVFVGPVGNGTGLWSLARQSVPVGATAAQTAMALYRNNQNAFIRGNINRLVAGKTLVIPTRDELFALDAGDAEREYLAALRGRPGYRAPITSVSPDALSRLRIAGAAAPRGASTAAQMPVTPGSAATPGNAPSPSSPQVQQDLLTALETSESTRQETVELRGRVKELETQLSDIQTLLKLRNAELARMQGGEAVPGALGERAPGESQPTVVAQAEIKQPMGQESSTGEETKAPPVGPTLTTAEQTAGASQPTEGADTQSKAEEAVTSPSLVPVPTPEPIPVTEAPVAVAPKPAATTAAPVVAAETTSTWNSLLLPLAGLAGVTALGILAFSWITARRRREEEEALAYGEEPEDLYEPLDATTQPRTSVVGEDGETIVATSKVDRGDLSEGISTPTKDLGVDSGVSVMSSLSHFDAETDEADVLSEADIYIAYGRHSEAQELLRNELRRSPERLDIKYKLAESFAIAKNLDALNEVLKEIQAAGGDTQDPAQWQRMRTFVGQLQSGAADPSPPVSMAKVQDLPPGSGDGYDDSLGLDMTDSFSLDVSDVQRGSEPTPRPDPFGDIDLGEDASFKISDDALDKTRRGTGIQDGLGFDRDSFGNALTVAVNQQTERDSELELTLEEHRVEDVDDLDSIFDSVSTDQPTLARNEMEGERPSGPDISPLTSSGRDDSSEPGLSPDQESVPTDLLSSQWQIDSGIWDETATKLDLARAYIEMDDSAAAREILEEVIAEGRDEQRSEAQAMLDKLS